MLDFCPPMWYIIITKGKEKSPKQKKDWRLKKCGNMKLSMSIIHMSMT